MEKKHVVIINGSGGVGKDSFVKLCSEYTSIFNISTVDKVKESARILGWNGDKDEKSRKFLSDIKLLATTYNRHPYNYVKKSIGYFRREDTPYLLMFIHCREPEEIALYVKDFDCYTLLIKNKNIKPINSNEADANVESYLYDFIIDNNEGLPELKEKAKKFVEMMRGIAYE
jgi:hypothetical protein